MKNWPSRGSKVVGIQQVGLDESLSIEPSDSVGCFVQDRDKVIKCLVLWTGKTQVEMRMLVISAPAESTHGCDPFSRTGCFAKALTVYSCNVMPRRIFQDRVCYGKSLPCVSPTSERGGMSPSGVLIQPSCPVIEIWSSGSWLLARVFVFPSKHDMRSNFSARNVKGYSTYHAVEGFRCNQLSASWVGQCAGCEESRFVTSDEPIQA